MECELPLVRFLEHCCLEASCLSYAWKLPIVRSVNLCMRSGRGFSSLIKPKTCLLLSDSKKNKREERWQARTTHNSKLASRKDNVELRREKNNVKKISTYASRRERARRSVSLSSKWRHQNLIHIHTLLDIFRMKTESLELKLWECSENSREIRENKNRTIRWSPMLTERSGFPTTNYTIASISTQLIHTEN